MGYCDLPKEERNKMFAKHCAGRCACLMSYGTMKYCEHYHEGDPSEEDTLPIAETITAEHATEFERLKEKCAGVKGVYIDLERETDEEFRMAYDELEGARLKEQERADRFEGMWNELKKELVRMISKYESTVYYNAYCNCESVMEDLEAEHEIHK